ncbi:MAG: hypothetical protein II719_01605, partial [Clostridia bacterium]|nr:hypothetical protein [Clostridia bacterium]
MGIFPLLVTEEISLDLIITRNPLLHQVEMCLSWMIPGDREGYEISDIRINDSLRFDESLSMLWENEAFLDLGPLIAEGLFSWEDLHSFHCRVLKTVWSKEDRRSIPVWEAECEVTIPQDFQPDFVFLPCLGAHAEKQLLCDDENMHITLLGLGRPAWSGGGTFG